MPFFLIILNLLRMASLPLFQDLLEIFQVKNIGTLVKVLKDKKEFAKLLSTLTPKQIKLLNQTLKSLSGKLETLESAGINDFLTQQIKSSLNNMKEEFVDLLKKPVRDFKNKSGYNRLKNLKAKIMPDIRSKWILAVSFISDDANNENADFSVNNGIKGKITAGKSGILTIYTERGTGEYSYENVPEIIYWMMFERRGGWVYWHHLIYFSSNPETLSFIQSAIKSQKNPKIEKWSSSYKKAITKNFKIKKPKKPKKAS